MNKMHSLAKIMFAGLALYIAINPCRNMIYVVWMATREPSLKSLGMVSLALLIMAVYLAAVFYFLIYKRDKWAKKLVGTSDLSAATDRIDWLPVAYRLVSVAVGLLCVYRFFTHVVYDAGRYIAAMGINIVYQQHYKTVYQQQYKDLITRELLGLIILIPIGIYLLCGAPHFVRWQVKKTLELCKEFNGNEYEKSTQETDSLGG